MGTCREAVDARFIRLNVSLGDGKSREATAVNAA